MAGRGGPGPPARLRAARGWGPTVMWGLRSQTACRRSSSSHAPGTAPAPPRPGSPSMAPASAPAEPAVAPRPAQRQSNLLAKPPPQAAVATPYTSSAIQPRLRAGHIHNPTEPCSMRFDPIHDFLLAPAPRIPKITWEAESLVVYTTKG